MLGIANRYPDGLLAATISAMKRYFSEVTAPEMADIAPALWNQDEASTDLQLLIEQYKLYVEMADRVSSRRTLANTFFLTLNTVIFAAIGVFWKTPPRASAWLGVFPLAVLILQCLVWYWIIRSYRQLNAGKWAVVGALEKRLPASPWWSAEWVALGEGRDPTRYWPLTHVEQWVPLLFSAAYFGGFFAIVLTRLTLQ